MCSARRRNKRARNCKTIHTQQGVDVINERSRNDPQGLQSLLGGFLGAGSGGIQQGKGQSGGGLGGMLGDILGG